MAKEKSILVKTLDVIHQAINRVNSFVHNLGAIATALFLSLLFVQVVLRYVFNSPIYGLDELVTALMVWSMALGFAIVYWENEHASIEFVMKKLPRWSQVSVYILTNVIVFASSLIMIYGGAVLFKLQLRTIPLGGLPFSRAYYYALPVAVMGALMAFMSAFRFIKYLITRDDKIMTEKTVRGGCQR